MKKTNLLLITGFLGAGKTTFLIGFLQRFRGKKLHVIVNEFGKVGVDGLLVSRLGAVVKEISGGSVFCTCRLDQFEQALQDALAGKPDIILVEASGLSDPSAIRQIADRHQDLAYTGCIALADAQHIRKVLDTSRMAARQLAVADVILLNKKDLVDEAQLDAILRLLQGRYPSAALHPTQQGAFEDEWLKDLNSAAAKSGSSSGQTRDITLQAVSISVRRDMTSLQLRQFLKLFAEDTYRVKGFVQLSDGVFQVDGIGGVVAIRPYESLLPADKNQITALAGMGTSLLNIVRKAQEWYPDLITGVD